MATNNKKIERTRSAATVVKNGGKSLRKKAERALKKMNSKVPLRTQLKDPQALIHDLRVHQIELEMQNMSLRTFTRDLEDAKHDLSDLYHEAPFAYVTLNLEGRILSANKAAGNLFRRTTQELAETLLTQHVAPDGTQTYLTALSSITAEAPRASWDMRMVNSLGGLINVHVSASLVYESSRSRDSHKTGYFVALTDITAYKWSEFERMRMSQELLDKTEESLVNQRQLLLLELEKNAALKKLSTIVAGVKIGIWEVDHESGQTTFDDTMYELYGSTRDEYPNPVDLYTKCVRSDDLAQLLPVLEARDPLQKIQSEFRTQRPSGEIRYLHMESQIEVSETGQVSRIRGIVYDVTEKVATNLLLEQTRTAIDTLALVSATDPQGKITYVNDIVCQVSGYSRQELLGQDHRILNSGYHEKSFFRHLWQTIQAGKNWKGEIRNKRKDGTFYWVSTSIYPLKNAQGTIDSYWSVRFETTQLKNSLEKLSTTTAQLQEAQRLGKVGSYSINTLTGEDVMSEEAKNIFGFAPDDPCDLTARMSRFLPEDQVRWKAAIEHAAQNNGVAEGEFRIIRPDQKLMDVFMRRQDTYGADGKHLTSTAIVQDITARKEAEQVKREHEAIHREKQEALNLARVSDLANQAKSNFLSTMSHEIRTPLGIMLGYADLLASDTGKSIDLHDLAHKMQKNGQHLLGLINDVLDLSKIEAGQFEANVAAVGTCDFLANLISTFSNQAAAKGLSLSIDVASSLPKKFFSDEKRLRQILINLVSNAIKFTEQGRVILKVACEPNETPSNPLNNPLTNPQTNPLQNPLTTQLIFTITDTGCGIPKENLSQVFAPFSQGDRSISRKYGGTGLGLSLSRNLARKIGGDVTLIKTEVGVGSQFQLSVPAPLTHPSSPETTNAQDGDSTVWISQSAALGTIMRSLPATEKAGAHQGRNQRDNKILDGLQILVCDDFEDNRALIQIMLDRLGAVVTVCEGANQCLELTKRQTFDLILMDIQMPIINGYEAATMLRAQGFSGPIVALTANALLGEKERCLTAGCTEYLSKPIDQMHLAQVILQLVPVSKKPSSTPKYDPNDMQQFEQPKNELPIKHTAGVDSPRPTKIGSSLPKDHPGQALIPIFASKIPGYTSEIKLHISTKDWVGLAALAHKLKGTGSSYGFFPVSDLCQKMEIIAKQAPPDLEQLNMLATELESVARRILMA
jgi:PAS domain S-box-containing protein